MKRRLAFGALADVFANAAFKGEDGFAAVTFVEQPNANTRVQVAELTKTLVERVVRKLDERENLVVREESNGGTRLAHVLFDDAQRLSQNAVLENTLVEFSITLHLHDHFA